MIDPERERQRLRDYYSRQMDGRLEQIAAQATELSELAQEVLREELIRRGLDFELLRPPIEKIPPEEPIAPTSEEPPVEEQSSSEEFEREFEKRDLVTIRRFRDLPDAYLAKGVIESAGIVSFLADDITIRLNWWWSNLLGGVKLRVDADEADAAQEILRQPIPESIDIEGVGEYQQPHCPRCQSLDVNFEELYKPIAYVSLYLRFPLPVHRKGWICQSCRHTWQEHDRENEANTS